MTLGIKSILGAAKETNYRAAVAVTDKIPYISESIERNPVKEPQDFLHGDASVTDLNKLFDPAGGGLEAFFPYTVKDSGDFVGTSLLLALAMGISTWHAGSGANRITAKDDLDVFGTLAWNKWRTSNLWELTSTYFKDFTLSLDSGTPLKFTTNVSGYDLETGANVTTNLLSALTGLPTKLVNDILMYHLEFRIGDLTNALVAGDCMGLSSFNLSFNNNLTDDEQASKCSSGHTDALKPIQPVRNGKREVMLELELPRFSDDTYFDWEDNETPLQAQFVFTHPSTGYQFIIRIPNLKIEKPSAPVAGSEVIKQTITLRCLRYNTDSPMTFTSGGTDNGEVWFETIDERTATIF